jgi:hypothetical protein
MPVARCRSCTFTEKHAREAAGAERTLERSDGASAASRPVAAQALGGGTAGEEESEDAASEPTAIQPAKRHSNSKLTGAGGGVVADRALHKGESPWHSRIAEITTKSAASASCDCSAVAIG